MAASCTCHNTEEAPGALTDGNGTPVSTLAISCAPTPAPAQTLALAPGPLGWYTDENLQRTTKLALESFVQGQKHSQLQANSASRERPLKPQFPDLYYGNSYLDCYCFCQ